MKRRKFKVVIIILIFILLILIGFVLIFKNRQKEVSDYTFENVIRERYNIEVLDDDIIIPNNAYKFFTEVTTDVNAKSIYENLDYFFKTVVNKYIVEIKSESDIEEYFDKNKLRIYKDTGIDKSENFSNLVTELLKVSNGKKLILQKLEFGDNYIRDEGFTYAEIEAKYENNISLNIYLKVFNTQNKDGVFIEYNVLDN